MTADTNSKLAQSVAGIQRFIESNLHDRPESLIEVLAEKFKDTAKLAEENDILDFHSICLLMISHLSSVSETAVPEMVQQLTNWLVKAQSYLNNSKDDDLDTLLDIFLGDFWSAPATGTNTSSIQGMLTQTANHPNQLTNKINKNGAVEKLPEEARTDTETITFTIEQYHKKLKHLIDDYIFNDIGALEDIYIELGKFIQITHQKMPPGLEDICLILHENIKELLNHQALSETHVTLLVAWIGLTGKYIENQYDPNIAKALLTNITDQHWPNPIGCEDAQAVAETMGISSDELIDTDGSKNTQSTYQNIIKATGVLQQLANQYDVDGSPNLAKIINNIEEIIDLAEKCDLPGFRDTCLLLQQNLEDIAANQKTLSNDQYLTLQQWVATANKYLKFPQQHTAADLIDLLAAAHWPIHLNTSDLAILKKDLFGISIETHTDTSNESIAPQPVSSELIDILLDEIKNIEQDFKEAISDTRSADEINNNNLVAQLVVSIERFGDACHAAELTGLYQASEILKNNLAFIRDKRISISATLQALINRWPKAVEEYLSSLDTKASGNNIVDLLGAGSWDLPLTKATAPALLALLNAPYLSETHQEESEPIEITAESASLKLPDGINQEILDGFLHELPTQTESFTTAIQVLLQAENDDPKIVQTIEKAQRIAHTLKGASSTVGINGITNLAHYLEDILLLLKKHSRAPSEALAILLMTAADCLGEMNDFMIGRGEVPTNTQQILAKLIDWIEHLKEADPKIPDTESLVSNRTDTTLSEESVSEENNESSENIPTTLNIPVHLIDDLIRLLGETVILTTQVQDRVKNSADYIDKLVQHNQSSHHLINQLEQHVVFQKNPESRKAINQNKVSRSLELEQYSELNTVTNQLSEKILDSIEISRDTKNNLHNLHELLPDQSNLQKELQNIVMRLRMVPILTIASRLHRCVRQTCRMTNKQVSLHLTGTDTLIDSYILEKLVDSLIHMLRNAVSHGIKAHGGIIDLSFSVKGNQIIVRCQDNGTGLDYDAIRATAIERGFIKPNDNPSPDELNKIILQPGFSTSKQTDQISGRGIGMDIVYTQVIASKGMISIESEKDKGCLIELRIPVTMISSHVLLIKHQNHTLALLNTGIEKILHLGDLELLDINEGTVCKYNGKTIKFNNLEDFLRFPKAGKQSPRDEARTALLIRGQDVNNVISVQKILGNKELVIKPIGKYFHHVPGIIGMTILGDGSVATVIDIPVLLRAPHKYKGKMAIADLERTNPLSLPFALVVDDSLSTRRALSQYIKDANYKVKTAKDGIEATEIISKKSPDIILVDLEMPRMNGLELADHIRKNTQTAEIPIIMVTSRATHKYRQQAEAAGINAYLTKPISEDKLLDQMRELLPVK